MLSGECLLICPYWQLKEAEHYFSVLIFASLLSYFPKSPFWNGDWASALLSAVLWSCPYLSLWFLWRFSLHLDFLHFEHGMSRCWKTELPGSVFWCLSVIFGKFLAITTSNIYCVLLSFFSPFEIILVFQLLVCYTFWNCHTVLRQSALLLLWIYNYYIMTGGTN